MFTTTFSFFDIALSKSVAHSSANPSITSKSNGFEFRPEISYGRIKNSALFSWGLGLVGGFFKETTESVNPTGSKTIRLGLMPVLRYEKFYAITPKVYYTPITSFTLGYIREKLKVMNRLVCKK